MKKSVEYALKQTTSNSRNSLFLLLLISLFSLVVIAGNVVNISLRKGISNTERRLGADIMIVPSGSRNDAESIILTGQRSSFYFSSSIYENISSVDGIEEITSQCFLKSLSADCCSSEVQIVFFDPETDFIVEPWISREYSAKLNAGEVIVGSGVGIENGTITLFDHEYPVVAQLSETGTSIDNSVYFSFESKNELINTAFEKGSFLTEDQKSTDLISSIYINVSDNSSVDSVLADCHRVSGSDFDVVYPRHLSDSLSGNLNVIMSIINVVMIASEAVIILIILITNHIYFSQRRQEIAILRVFGNSKKSITRMLLSEVNIVGAAGAVAGIFLAWLILIPFGNYIGFSLEMPYLGPDLGEVLLVSILTLLLVLIVISFSSVFSILRVCNMEIYDALRKEAE